MTLALCALFCIFISKSILWHLCQIQIEKSPTTFKLSSEGKCFHIQILASDEFMPTTGKALHRRWPVQSGNNPFAWVVAEATPRSADLIHAGDFDANGSVNNEDFSILSAAWYTTSRDSNWNPLCDISNIPDDVIDLLDLAVFSYQWLNQAH
jgi:hypothetical protein